MNSNYIIITDNDLIFGGWNRLGEITMLSSEHQAYAYRMSRTLAMRTLVKVENFTHQKCHIISA